MLALLKRQAEAFRIRMLLGDEMESETLRRIFRERFDIEVGLYSYGCFDRWRIASGVRIGRYTSIARTTYIVRSNHLHHALTTHPYLYDPSFGVVEKSAIAPSHVVIEDDVWMGHYSMTTPGCTRIGRGAVVGAGAVVTKDVPAYAVVAGVPAKIVRMRFDRETIAAIEASHWWKMSKAELTAFVRANPQAVLHPSAEALGRISR